MYDGKTQLLIENPINRYLVNSPMIPDMKTNPDGSLTLYIQKDSPGKDKEANWLPAPNGPIYLVMRLYWPKTEAPSVLPAGEGTGSRRRSQRFSDAPQLKQAGRQIAAQLACERDRHAAAQDGNLGGHIR